MSVKEHLKRSQDLEKQLLLNKTAAEARTLKLDRLDEATKLLDESSQKYEQKALDLERQYASKWRRLLIGFGVFVGSLVVVGVGGQVLSSNSSDRNY